MMQYETVGLRLMEVTGHWHNKLDVVSHLIKHFPLLTFVYSQYAKPNMTFSLVCGPDITDVTRYETM
jgi:choline kinase